MHAKKEENEIYFLTGAAGFIGANLLRRLLDESCAVHILLKESSNCWRIAEVLKHPKLTVHYGDLADQEALSELLRNVQPTVVYHLATRGAYSSQNDPKDIFETNLLGTLHLLEVARGMPLKLFVNTSSTSEYGSKNQPMKEDDVLEPDSFYAISKVAATHACHQYYVQYSVPVVTLRLFSVFGPWESPTRLFPTLLESLRLGNMMNMVKPETARDFIFISDVIDLYRKIELLSKFPGEVFNVGSGKQTSLKQLSEVAVQVTKKKSQFAWKAVPSKSWDKDIWVADMHKTYKTLNWSAKVSVEEGLREYWSWYLHHHQIYHSMLH